MTAPAAGSIAALQVDPAGSTGRASRLRPWISAGLSLPALDAVRLALTVAAAMYLAMQFELQVPAWAGWTVLSVTLATRASSIQKCMWRTISAVIGGGVSIVLVAAFAQSTLAFDVGLAIWFSFSGAMASVEPGQRSYGFASMGFTVPIVTLGGVEHPETVFLTAVDRCSTIVLGIVLAHASAVLVQTDVSVVSRSLAERLDAAAAACGTWIREPAPADAPPIAKVLALDGAIADAFTEQPSLQVGGGAFGDAPLALLRLLAVGLLRGRVERTGCADGAALLGPSFAASVQKPRRIHAVARMLRAGRRADLRKAPYRRLGLDRDMRRAMRDGIRSAAAVSLVNAFWYFSYWPSGGTAVTWAGLLSVLNAARPNPARVTRDFLIGATLAAAVGVTLHYTALTTTSGFGELAAILLPICMVTALGRADKRATLGAGFGFLILTALDATNVMKFQLDATLNDVLAAELGMGVAVIAFAGLPPPVSDATHRTRAMRRLAKGVRAAALLPRIFRPDPGRWLGRGFVRLDLLSAEEPGVRRNGESLVLAGALILALRDDDEAFGRRVGRAVWWGTDLESLAEGDAGPELQRDRVRALAAVLGGAQLAGWPGWPEGARR